MSALEYGYNQVFYGDKRLIWGVEPPVPIDDGILAHWTITATYRDTNTTYRAWTGRGELQAPDNNRYTSALGILSISNADDSSSAVGQPRIQIAATSVQQRDLLLRDPGTVDIELRQVYSVDGGAKWLFIPRAVRGILDAPTYRDGIYEFTVANRSAELGGSKIKYWSLESAEQGDLGLEHQADIANGEVEIEWPP